MSQIVIEISVILVLILLNGALSMSELAIVSARKNRLQERAEAGSAGAQAALKLTGNPGRFLSTVQIGITLIGILNGAVGGATIAEEIGRGLAGVPYLRPYSTGIGVAVVVLVITYLSLVLGELVPKRLALNNAESAAARLAPLMRGLAFLTRPLVALLSGSTDLVLHLIGARPSTELPVTEEDVRSMISQGTRLGVFEATEQEMVSHVFRLADRRISSVMTPRTEVTFLEAEASLPEIQGILLHSGFSHFPVYSGSPDNIIGIVHVKDLFHQMLTGHRMDITTALTPPLFLPETSTALEVLEQMKQDGLEIALIIDEFGGLAGLVSLTDLVEAIVGDLEQPKAGEEAEIVRREDGSFLLGGMLLIDELKVALGLGALPDEDKGYYETVGGFLMTVLGRVPETGDTLEWGGYRFEVVDMDGRRVDKILAIPTGRPRNA